MRPISTVIGAALAAALSSAGLIGVAPAAAAGPRSVLPTPVLIERAVRTGRISGDRGNLYLAYALGDHRKLPSLFRSAAPWDGTVPLFQLRRSFAKMRSGGVKREVARALAAVGSPGTCGTSTSALPSTYKSDHFYIEYGPIGGGLTLQSYKNSLETSWATEVGAFGWAAPPLLPAEPPDGKYHVRIDTLAPGLYGFVSAVGTHAGLVGDNPATSWNDIDAHATCMVLRNDYSGFPSSPQDSLNATVAHELNHSIQFGYGAFHGSNKPDWIFFEGGATWMEDEVFDYANDNYHFLWPAFAESMGDYDGSFFGYEYWITFRGLTERFATGTAGGAEQVMQDFWEETSKNTGDNLTALQAALANRGTTLADAFHEYATAVKFNKPCVDGHAYPYCLREGPDYVATRGPTNIDGSISTIGGSYLGNIEDNYALNWVRLPTASDPYPVKLMNVSDGGQLRGSVVCDTGSTLLATALQSVVGPGASTQLSVFDPSGCASVIGVITNQSQTAPNPVHSEKRSYLLSTDATPPLAPAIDGSTLSKPFQTNTKIDLSWGVAEAARYDVRYRSAPYGGDFGGFVSWQTGTSGTSAAFIGSPGRSYCFSARATDANLNTSEYGAERCTAIPTANTASKHRGAWTKRKGNGYFLGRYSMTSTQGASLVLANVQAKRLALVVTKCPRCGTVKVFFRNKLLRRIRLGAGSTRKKQIVNLAVFNTVRSGKLRVVVTSSGRPVKIEGLGVSAV